MVVAREGYFIRARALVALIAAWTRLSLGARAASTVCEAKNALGPLRLQFLDTRLQHTQDLPTVANNRNNHKAESIQFGNKGDRAGV